MPFLDCSGSTLLYLFLKKVDMLKKLYVMLKSLEVNLSYRETQANFDKTKFMLIGNQSHLEIEILWKWQKHWGNFLFPIRS